MKKIVWERIDKNTFKDTEETVQPSLFNEEEFGGSELDMSDHVDFTLFGTFHRKSIQNPFNLYNYDYMYLGHMIGFNANSDCFYTYTENPRQKHRTIDFVEGVAACKVIDTHKIVFVPAKYYEAEDVMKSIEDALIDSKDMLAGSDLLDKCRAMSKEYNDRSHAILMMPTGLIMNRDATDPSYDAFIREAKLIKEEHPDSSLLIIDGEEYEHKKTPPN